MHLELKAELLGELGETALVLGQLRRVSRLLAQHDFIVDEVENCLWVTRESRVPRQVGLDGGALAPLPALALVVPKSRLPPGLNHS
jgi:hypothetical protein